VLEAVSKGPTEGSNEGSVEGFDVLTLGDRHKQRAREKQQITDKKYQVIRSAALSVAKKTGK